MSHRTDLWLALAGLLASSVNAAAGGGTLLSFPSLMAAGLTPLSANATSTVGLLPGYVASLAGYRREVTGALRGEMLRSAVPSVFGGALGAWLLVALGAEFFRKVVPSLLVGASALLVAQPVLARLLASRRAAMDRPFVLVVGTFIVALYGGYFGAGAGIVFLAVMGLLIPRPLGEVNAVKIFVSLLANLLAALTFIVLELVHPTGALVFRAAAPLAVGSALGGYFGVRVVRRLPPSGLRAFAAAVGGAIAVYLIVR